MPLSLTLTRLGRNQSSIQAQTCSIAGATSFDTITLVHGLGKTPDRVRATLRCIRSAASSGAPAAVFLSANASLAIMAIAINNVVGTPGAVQADFDFECEVIHSVVR